MDLQQFLDILHTGEPIPGACEVHEYMHQVAQETFRLTARLNTGYHTPDEIRDLFSAIIGKPVDKTVTLFPLFYTECGKNITVGRNVFINMGCKFQDHGGVVLEDGVLIGHNVVLATLNHDLNPDRRQGMIPRPIHMGRTCGLVQTQRYCPA